MASIQDDVPPDYNGASIAVCLLHLYRWNRVDNDNLGGDTEYKYRLMHLKIDKWVTPASSYKEGQVGNYRLKNYIWEGDVRGYHNIDGYSHYYSDTSIPIMHLQEYRDGDWYDWMVDDPMNFRCMQKYAAGAEGDVLTTGLGLGLVAHELAKNDKVTSITIVERNPYVRDLVWPSVKIGNLVMDDFWHFVENDDTKWGMIIVDHWVFDSRILQFQLLVNEAHPAYEKLRKKYPDSRLVFHGFDELNDIDL